MSTKSVILIDFDNIFSTLWQLDGDAALRFGNEPMRWLPLLADSHLALGMRRWLVARCYLNPAGWVYDSTVPAGRLFFSRFRPGLVRAGFEVIDCPTMTQAGKNAADIRIVIDALELLRGPCVYDEFVIGSGDSDFTPLVQKLRASDRHVTLICPGPSSPAYTSLADRLIDYDGLEALVRPETAATLMTSRADIGDDISYAAFRDFITRLYVDANAPLHLASVAQKAVGAVPQAREREWFGLGGFAGAVAHLRLPHARVSGNYLWDEERHQPPEPSVGHAGVDLPETIQTIVRVADLPRLGRKTWPHVFRILARYADEHEFNLTESTRWSRDELAAEGVQVGRPALGFIVRGAQFGGAALDKTPPPDAREIAQAFASSVLERARLGGVSLDAVAEAEVRDWLGLASPAEGDDPRTDDDTDAAADLRPS